jgi:hypothetical protein
MRNPSAATGQQSAASAARGCCRFSVDNRKNPLCRTIAIDGRCDRINDRRRIFAREKYAPCGIKASGQISQYVGRSDRFRLRV